MEPTEFNFRRLRALLAARMISHTEFASACGLSRSFASRVLTGHPAGELARMKIERGMKRLGLDTEQARAS